MLNQLNVPKEIVVGQQNRQGTYTGRLAYIIYKDEKGKLRKEGSWNGWRDKTIEPLYLDNVPTEGFVLNKKAGGYDTGWNHRATYCRVFDPRGFEFEITIPNLLFILANADCSRGKGLEGKFVYAWEGKDLVLLPEEAQEYKASVEFTELKSMKVSLKTLVPGHIYHTKKQKDVVYIGKFIIKHDKWRSGTIFEHEHIFQYVNYEDPSNKYENYNEWSETYHLSYQTNTEKFRQDIINSSFVELTGADLAKVVSDQVVPDFADRISMFDATNLAVYPENIEVTSDPFQITKNEYKYNGEFYGQYLVRIGENKYKKFELYVVNNRNRYDYSYKYHFGNSDLNPKSFMMRDLSELTIMKDNIKVKKLTGTEKYPVSIEAVIAMDIVKLCALNSKEKRIL